MAVDKSLVNGGLEEVAQTKRENPPKKSPMMDILSSVGKKGAQGDDNDEDDLALDSIGCTANVCLVDYAKKKLFVANAGDSRCVMGRGGEAVGLSVDHKPDDEIEKARIEAAGSVVTEGRVDGHLNLSRAIGDLKFKKKEGLKDEEHPITSNPDVYEYDLGEDCDFILMGCDGCWETKSNEEMVGWVYDKLKAKPDKSISSIKEIVHDLLNELVSPNYQETGK